MKNSLKLSLLSFASALFFNNVSYAQPQAKFSIETSLGIPSILTKASPVVTPNCGLALRYSFNPYASVALTSNGGNLAYRNAGWFARNNYLLFGVEGAFNISSVLNNRSEMWRKTNFYANLGMGGMNYYYTLFDIFTDTKLSRTHLWYQVGLQGKYYLNEFIDITASTNFYFAQTKKLDNVRTGSNDMFNISSIGLAFKLLPYERKQLEDWKHISIGYTTSAIEMTKAMLAKQDQDLKAQMQAKIDSLAAVLRPEIQAVESKVNTANTKIDTVDSKANQILDILNKMNTPPPAPEPKTKGKKGKATTTKQTKVNTPLNSPADSTQMAGKSDSSATNTPKVDPKKLTYTTPDGGKVKVAVLKPEQVKENYAIVVGSYSQDQNALKERDFYINKGWDTHILGTPKSTLKRVVIFSNNYFEAVKIVTELRQTGKPDAWMLDVTTGKGVYIK